MSRALVVKVTCGADDAERCNQAFNVAALAAASGVEVSLWLAGEAAWFGVAGKAEEFTLPLASPLAALRDTVLTAGTVTVCSQCAERRGIAASDLLDGVRVAGAAAFVEETLREGVQALVY